jgi:hypothetical protein
MESALCTRDPVSRLAVNGGLCCRVCVQPVTVTGDPQWGLAVRTATRAETADDGHLVASIDANLMRALLTREADARR